MTDLLEDLFERQGSFDQRVQSDPRFPPFVEDGWLPNQRRINALMNFMASEVREVKEALGFLENDQVKWWKQSIDWEHVFEETIDILHVILSTWRAMNKTAKQVHAKYIEKNAVNHQRQDEGY